MGKAFALSDAYESPFHRFCRPGGPDNAGVVVRERRRLHIATLISRSDATALAEAMMDDYGLALPASSKRVEKDDLAIVGVGPRTWMLIRTGQKPPADALQLRLGRLAAVTDQSSGYGVLRISGPKARETFEKGLSIDLHPRVFAPGDAAVTACAHIGVMLWQLDETPSYEVALFRSLAGSFWHWLLESAAEYGLRVDDVSGD
jgi:heterotetrameric sarcosine oxidase gamma subunit